ncbi:MAG: TatD family hydrolase [Gemmatimonadetes bacterium]|nr:TatD family hydrolase [Gemmatimonadota bacterium]
MAVPIVVRSPLDADVLPMVDTHCHVDLYSDPAAVVRQADARRIYTVAVTNTPSVFDRLKEIVGESQYVRVALGLHPELAMERAVELPLFETRIAATRYIGEVGLDYVTTVETARATQRRVLATVIGWCDLAGDKIVTVHSRRAAEDVVDAFGKTFRGTYILHWYSGGVRTLRRALYNGAYVSVNPAMVRSDRAMALLAEVPQERVLTETDGPFVQVAGEVAEPRHVEHAVTGLATLWRMSPAEARAAIFANFSAILRGHGGKWPLPASASSMT